MDKNRIIVVGGGVAGLSAALKALEQNVHVDIFSLSSFRRSPSVADRSGINGALNTKGENDSPEEHTEETLLCGEFLESWESVEKMCRMAPGVISLYERIGVPFKRTVEGLIDLKTFDADSKKRTVIAGESTGQQLLNALDSQVRKYESAGRARRFEFWHFDSIVKDENGLCRGIVATNLKTLDIRHFAAHAVIICSGGYGALYGGAGVVSQSAASSVYQQGALLSNMEFVQFDKNEAGNISVLHTLGGLFVGENYMTTIEGLFAAGRCANIHHGARCLPGNSLLSDTVSGLEAGSSAADYAWLMRNTEDSKNQSIFEKEVARQLEWSRNVTSQDGEENVYLLKKELGEVMSSLAGAEKNNSGLTEADARLNLLLERLFRCGNIDRSKWANHEIILKKDMFHMINLAKVVAQSSLNRNESRGVFYKADCPEKNESDWRKKTLAEYTVEGPKLDYLSVESSADSYEAYEDLQDDVRGEYE